MSYQESNPDLESFREQWRAEVRARHPVPASSLQQQQQNAAAGPATTANSARAARPIDPRGKPPPATRVPAVKKYDDEDEALVQPPAFDEPAPTGSTSVQERGPAKGLAKTEPVTALEHYEKAVEREAAGNLGDSLRLYRKAFRMDDSVDQKYKNKHFPKPPLKPVAAASSGSSREGAASTPKAEQPQSMKDLIASFAGLSIEPVPPEIEGMPQPPCPIASLPTEILVHILRDVAILDIGDFVRLSQVCKRFAYLVATENRIWRRICLGTEFGFGGMHYYWQRQITWDPLTEADLLREAEEAAATAAAEAEAATDAEDSTTTTSALPSPAVELSLSARAQRHAEESAANTLAFYRALYSSSWQRMFRFRPRVRFNGCYICTVNYIRAGQASPHTTTWNTPVHIVTYYRYLRFFRDGTCISLLTTAEPADVVHHLTREAVTSGVASNNAASQSALKGRWRLARESDNPGASISEVEGDLMIETEGVAKYIFRLDLAFKTAGRAAKNNKLVWKGFYSYNTLTGDWAEFTLRDNTPFFFSRVKSYGVRGE